MIKTGGVHSASYLVGTGGCFPGVKMVKREDDHYLATSAEVRTT
jgi:hypothetical protein